MAELEFGNLETKINGERGWIFGDFEGLHSTPFHTKEFEVKWSKFSKGEKKDAPAKNQLAKTCTILIKGILRLDFPESKESKILEHEGDYAYFSGGISHSWEVLEDAFIITIRWPSIPGDQKKKILD